MQSNRAIRQINERCPLWQPGREKRCQSDRSRSLGGQRRSWEPNVLPGRRWSPGEVESHRGEVDGPGGLQVQGGLYELAYAQLPRELDPSW